MTVQRVVGREQGKGRFKPLFVQFVLENVWAVYEAAMLKPYGNAHVPWAPGPRGRGPHRLPARQRPMARCVLCLPECDLPPHRPSPSETLHASKRL